ncbi:hypothetical protein B0O80DRAFT_450583 [Mortierella sp. GBAus27b]|nr:hypothetical protein B0O80DRAFT_450583 [Mortierella sp. GBAus27b]
MQIALAAGGKRVRSTFATMALSAHEHAHQSGSLRVVPHNEVLARPSSKETGLSKDGGIQ